MVPPADTRTAAELNSIDPQRNHTGIVERVMGIEPTCVAPRAAVAADIERPRVIGVLNGTSVRNLVTTRFRRFAYGASLRLIARLKGVGRPAREPST